MYIRYKLYRSSVPDEVFNSEMIEVPIENDDHIVMIDKILQDVLTQHISNLPEVQKYGTGYIGRMEIVNIEINDNDNLNLTEEAFRHYMSTILPHLEIIWSQTDTNMNNEEKAVKSENKEN